MNPAHLLPVIDGQTCARSGRVILTSCLQVLTFYVPKSVASMAVWTNIVEVWTKKKYY